MVDLSVKFMGVKFKNPVVASSGTITRLPHNMRRCIEAGVGAVTTKSFFFNLRYSGRPAHPAYVFLDKYGRRGWMDCAVGHQMLNAELGHLKYIEEIKPIAEREGVVLIASLNSTPQPEPVDDKAIVGLAKRMEEVGVDILEINSDCPIYTDIMERRAIVMGLAESIRNILKGEVSIPFYTKIMWQTVPMLLEYLEVAESQGEKACHFTPERNMAFIDIETARPVVPVSMIWGPDFLPMNTYAAASAFKKTKLQLMYSGSLWTWRDVVEIIMSGATLVAAHTAAMYKGYKVFTEMINGLRTFMERKGYQKMEDLTGVAATHVDNLDELRAYVRPRMVPKESVVITVDEAKCNGCERCLVCIQDAITMEDGIAQIDLELCERCGVCESICPVGAIAIK